MMTENEAAIEILKSARKIFNGGKNWTQGVYRTNNNQSFCSIGACRKASGFYSNSPESEEMLAGRQLAQQTLNNFTYKMEFKNLPNYNDKVGRSFKEIDTLFKKAILYLGG